MAPHPLDNPVRSSLTGPHARLAERRGNVLRYPADVCPFLAMPDEPGACDWADAAALLGPGGLLPLAGVQAPPPAGWAVEMTGEGVQMTGDEVAGAADPEALPLGPADVPEMLDLAWRTKPGPFLPRTVEMGSYLGIRCGGVLVAMAGERLHPSGWTEISAVCTDAADHEHAAGVDVHHRRGPGWPVRPWSAGRYRRPGRSGSAAVPPISRIIIAECKHWLIQEMQACQRRGSSPRMRPRWTRC